MASNRHRDKARKPQAVSYPIGGGEHALADLKAAYSKRKDEAERKLLEDKLCPEKKPHDRPPRTTLRDPEHASIQDVPDSPYV